MMKFILSMIALMVGFILLGFGNDLGILGLFPAMAYMFKEESMEEMETRKKG